MNAKETEYNGYRFRSRLEARWAVFFDAAKIEYEYEPEGFDLSSGGYLPDFYLPDYELYVEIKPFDRKVVSYSGDYNKWEKKCDTFRSEVGKAILLCYEDPSPDIRMQLFAYDTTDSSGGEYVNDAVFKQKNGSIYVVACDSRQDRTLFISNSWVTNKYVITASDWVRMNIREIASDATIEVFDFKATDILNVAKKEARQARFEHGEKPLPSRFS